MQDRSHSVQDFACSVIFCLYGVVPFPLRSLPLVRMVFRSSTPRTHI